MASSQKEQLTAAERLLDALRAWESYPMNLQTIQHMGRPRFLRDVKKHFGRTKQNVLLIMPKSTNVARKNAVERNIKNVWFDLTSDEQQKHNDVFPEPKGESLNSSRSFDDYLGVSKGFRGMSDPTFRFIILKSSAPDGPRLWITDELLLKIATYHQVSPYFLCFISHIRQEGQLSDLSDIPFSGFRRVTSFSHSLASSVASATTQPLGRSEHHYQLIFELRTVFKNNNDDDEAATQPSVNGKEGVNIWPITQSVVYHRFDVSTGKSVWILTAGKEDEANPFYNAQEIKESLSGLHHPVTPNTIDGCFASNLSAMVWLGDWSLSEFDAYITMLDEQMQLLALSYINKTKDGAAVSEASLKKLNKCMETLQQCIIALESNLRVYKGLIKFYGDELLKDGELLDLDLPWLADGQPRARIKKHTQAFRTEMQSVCDSIREMIRRAGAVRELGKRREDTTFRLLQNRDTTAMKSLTETSLQQTNITTILSTITIVLLPMSVVSSIFSTDIVRFGPGKDSGGDSGVPGHYDGGFAGKWSGPAVLWWALTSILATAVVGLIAKTFLRRSAPSTRLGFDVNVAAEASSSLHYANTDRNDAQSLRERGDGSENISSRFMTSKRAKLERVYYDVIDQSRAKVQWVKGNAVKAWWSLGESFRLQNNNNNGAPVVDLEGGGTPCEEWVGEGQGSKVSTVQSVLPSTTVGTEAASEEKKKGPAVKIGVLEGTR
ncbi:hypothetical protein QBC43DRAFT_328170 [Cladorrhinum sp. PSN259]|nr:hypothetical protein QBC43DRAFT_328170 [Cladorrhinum sp. PSN259]